MPNKYEQFNTFEKIVKNKEMKEMIGEIFPAIVKISRKVIFPRLKNKGVEIINQGNDLGEIVTNIDINASEVILNGNNEMGITGLRDSFSGSFSEENDSKTRMESLEIYEVDPLDGTGDMTATIKTDKIISPTLIISRLTRESLNEPFKPVTGMIYNILDEYAAISDGKELLIGKADNNTNFKSVSVKNCSDYTGPIRINFRHLYPQKNAQNNFIEFIKGNGINIKQIRTGGAGLQMLQFIRSIIEPIDPESLPSFYQLEPIDIIFNTQPDWKTWDIDPSFLIAKTFDLKEPTDIFGEKLTANASKPTLKEMHLTKGAILSNNIKNSKIFIDYAQQFTLEFYKNLMEKNY